MNLPRTYGEFKGWLLRQLPIWVQYGNKKALSDYVHKYIMPTLTPLECAWLAQWFTVIFSDGFDPHGDFSAWTGTAGDRLPVVTSDVPHHGTYVMRCAEDKLPTGGYTSCAYKDFVDPGVGYVYARNYVRYSDITGSENMGAGINSAICLSDAGVWGGSINPVWNAAESKTMFRYRDDYFGGTYWSTVEVVANTWYWVELKLVKSGNGEWWIGGVSQGADIGNNGNQPINRVSVGAVNGGNVAFYMWADCVVVADAYIGPEVAIGTKASSSIASLMTPLVVNRLI